MNLIKTLVRDDEGKFAEVSWLTQIKQNIHDNLVALKPSKRSVIKSLFVAVALGSLYLNYFMYRQFMVVRCDVGGSKVGYFMTQEQCGDLDNAHTVWAEADNATILANNPDLK